MLKALLNPANLWKIYWGPILTRESPKNRLAKQKLFSRECVSINGQWRRGCCAADVADADSSELRRERRSGRGAGRSEQFSDDPVAVIVVFLRPRAATANGALVPREGSLASVHDNFRRVPSVLTQSQN